MAEKQTQETLKVGQVVSFKGYTNLEEGISPLLTEGDRIMIMKINEGETDTDQEFEVRPVDEKGAVINGRDGDMLFSDEFNVLQPVEEVAVKAKAKAKTKTKVKAKAKTKRQIAKEAAVEKAEAKAVKLAKEAAEAKAALDEEAPAKKTKAKTTPKAKVANAKAVKAAAKKVKTKAKTKTKTKAKAKVKAKAKEADHTTDSDAPVVDYTHDPAVKALLRKSNNIVEVASTLAAQHEEIYFKLGGVLAKIHGDGMHVDAGYEDTADGFDAYVNQNIGGLGKRKAYYLIKIYRHLRRAGITSAQLKTIGWTKARALSKVPVEDLNDEWLEKARTKTRNDLEAEIKASYVNAEEDGNETTRRVRYSFVLIGDANTLVERALEYSKSESGEVNPNAAFENICTQYLALNENMEGAATGLPMNGDELTEYAAEKLGLDISIMGPVNSEAGEED